MRMYQPLWLRLRKDRQIRVSAPKDRHRTLILLIRREARRDLAYQKLLESQNKKFFINTASIGDSLILTLRVTMKSMKSGEKK